MLRYFMLSFLVSLGARAQTTDVDLYKQLQSAINLPLLVKAAPPNQAYEARLYGKSSDPIYIIQIVSGAGSKHFFTLDAATNEVKSIIGAKVQSNGLNVVFKQGHYQFVCSYGYFVVD
jgi:hypothetical protein